MVDTKKDDNRKATVTRESEISYVWQYEDHRYTALRDPADVNYDENETEEEFLARHNDIFWSEVRLLESDVPEMKVGSSKTYYEDDGIIE